MGKALMEQQPISATLSLPLRKQILTTPITFSDLEFVDSDLYRNLVYLQDECEDVSALDMDFTVTYRSNGKTLNFNLIEVIDSLNVLNVIPAPAKLKPLIWLGLGVMFWKWTICFETVWSYN